MDWNRYIGGKNTIIEYIRDTKGNKIGVLLATIYDDKVCFGWSLCNKKDRVDGFNSAFGIEIAADRAFNNNRYLKYISKIDDYFINEIIPMTVANKIYKLLDRIVRYYKQNEMSPTVNYLLESLGYF